MNNIWLRQFFKNDGHVLDAYVPHKIRKNRDVRFDFVSFSKKEEALNAIKRNHMILVKVRTLQVHQAMYDRPLVPPSTSLQGVNNNQKNKTYRPIVWRPANRDGRSYKEVLGSEESMMVEVPTYENLVN